MSFRRSLKQLILSVQPLTLVFLRLFFAREYLRGRYFEGDVRGTIWCMRSLWARNILRLAPPMPFPAALTVTVTNWRNLQFHPEDINNFHSPGTYFQCSHARIVLGQGVYIGPNVGLITANHDPTNLHKHADGEDIVLGDRCWVGMNSVILPGVRLGPGTIVAAGSVVNRSFPQGACIIAGAPAVLKKSLEG